MQAIVPLEYERIYHIYNRGVGSANLFTCEEEYQHFLRLYDHFVAIVADTYAWALLKNHFHLLVRIKDEEDIPLLGELPSGYFSTSESTGTGTDTDRSGTLSGQARTLSGRGRAWDGRKLNPSRQFSHLFNAYTRYFNKRNDRHGVLFETPFKRISVDNKDYFRRLVHYIHHNPVKHGFVEDIIEWGWSSYLTIISVKPTKLHRETVLGCFDSAANFKAYHQQTLNSEDIHDWLLE
jgi:REP element-mobilizing transposase RayT